MSRERGDFNKYCEEARAKAIAEAGQAEALGFNCRALKTHFIKTDEDIGRGNIPGWEQDWIETEEMTLGRGGAT